MTERDGIWTRVVIEPDRVVVKYSSTYICGAVAKWLMISALIGWCLFPLFFRHLEGYYAILASSLVGVILIKWGADTVQQACERIRYPYLVILDQNACADGGDSASCIHADGVDLVEVRENLDRRADDLALWQTYLQVKNGNAVLIHQRVKWNLQAELALAQSLADRWNVPLKSPPAAMLG